MITIEWIFDFLDHSRKNESALKVFDLWLYWLSLISTLLTDYLYLLFFPKSILFNTYLRPSFPRSLRNISSTKTGFLRYRTLFSDILFTFWGIRYDIIFSIVHAFFHFFINQFFLYLRFLTIFCRIIWWIIHAQYSRSLTR